MKQQIAPLLFFISAIILLNSCDNPFKDVDIRVDSNIFKYTTILEVKSTSGQSLDNANITISGPDADKIYNGEGRKVFKVTGGILLLALDPKVQPEKDKPVSFSVSITAPDYLPISIPVLMNKDQNSGLVSTTMLNTKTLPDGINSKTSTVALGADGSTTTPVTVSTTTGSGVTETVNITLPTGTKFKDANGNTITGGNVSINTLVANTSNNDVLNIFPGGSLSLPEIKTQSGSTVAGALLPAALTEISMNVGGTAIKNFTQPIEILLQLNPNYINPKTSAVVKAGDQLDVYSYSETQGVWTFESTGTVILSSGKLALKATTTHLSWFTGAAVVTSCNNNYNLKFNASWLPNGITHPVSYKVFTAADQKQIAQGTFTVTNGTEGVIRNLPSTAITISFYDIQGNLLATQNIQTPCSVNTLQAISLNASPVSNNPKVTMQLYVRCPNNVEKVTILPTFYLYYKNAGTTENSFKLLGTVTKGFISTALLDPTKTYDFKAVWGTFVKYAYGKKVNIDNTATVGDGSNELIGTKAGATNLKMLSEVCKENGF